MHKRIFFTVVAVAVGLLFLPGQAVGQEFGVTTTESRLFNVEAGFLTGYHLGVEETVVGRQLALNFAIMENAELGVVNAAFDQEGGGLDQAYNLVRFNYFFNEQVALSVATGGTDAGDAAGAVGGNFVILRNIPDDGPSSTLKATVQYLMNEDDGAGDGTFSFALLGTIGL